MLGSENVFIWILISSNLGKIPLKSPYKELASYFPFPVNSLPKTTHISKVKNFRKTVFSIERICALCTEYESQAYATRKRNCWCCATHPLCPWFIDLIRDFTMYGSAILWSQKTVSVFFWILYFGWRVQKLILCS